MSLTGAARIAGIMGWPVSQAFSPRLHGFRLNEMGIDGALVPLAVKPEDFSTVVRGLMKAGFKDPIAVQRGVAIYTEIGQRHVSVLVPESSRTAAAGQVSPSEPPRSV